MSYAKPVMMVFEHKAGYGNLGHGGQLMGNDAARLVNML